MRKNDPFSDSIDPVIDLARKITSLVVNSKATYQEALDALEHAEEMLRMETRPTQILF